MPDEATLDRRLRAVERTLTDGDHDVDALREAGALSDRIETLENELADAEERITELEAATQALRGYVGNIRSVNEDVEQRADAALAAIDRLEEQFENRQPSQRDSRASVHCSERERPERDRSRMQRPDRQRRTDEARDETRNESQDSDDAGLLQRVRTAL